MKNKVKFINVAKQLLNIREIVLEKEIKLTYAGDEENAIKAKELESKISKIWEELVGLSKDFDNIAAKKK